MNRLKHIGLLALLGCSLLLLSSCDKMPENGDLDGMWQLMTIQTPQGTRQVQQQAYIIFYMKLAEWRVPVKPQTLDFHYYSHFNQQGDSLCFYDLCHASAHTVSDSDDIPVTVEEIAAGALADWGIHTLHTRYRVLQLNAKHLTLEKADTVYAFRKF